MRPFAARRVMLACAALTALFAIAAPASPAADAPDAVAPAWSQLPPPGGLYGSAMTVDTRRGRAIVFGGSDQFASHAEVWSAKLDGTFAWSRLPVPIDDGPAPREGARAFYDEARDRLLLFGGISTLGYFGDLWELDLGDSLGLHWRQVGTNGPAGRAFASMVLDSRRQRLLVYGGFGAGVVDFGDVWAVPLVGPPIWSRLEIPDAGPGARSRHTAIYDRLEDRMVVFGGNVAELPRNDVWSLKLEGEPSWSAVIAPVSPTARCGHSAVYDAAQERMVVFGGFDTFYASDTWALSLAEGTWTQLAIGGTPRGRLDHAAAFDEAHNREVVFGGFNSEDGYLNDVWLLGLDGNADWSQAQANGMPRPRQFHSAIYDSEHDRMVIFGGQVASSNGIRAGNDAWALTLDDHPQWSAVAPSLVFPRSRSGAAIAYDSRRSRMIGYGGSGPAILDDVFALNLRAPATWSTIWPTGPAPPARTFASAVYDSLRDRVVIYGGRGNTPFNDVWLLSLEGSAEWSQPVIDGQRPGSRDSPVFVIDPVHDRAILFGGMPTTSGGPRIDVWQLSLAPPMTWTRLNPDNNPPARRSSQIGAFDHTNDRLVVFGGGDSLGSHSDVWALSLEDKPHWTVLETSADPPPGRSGATAVFDSRRGRLVVFGGNLRNDTWALQVASAAPATELGAPLAARIALAARAFPNPTRGDLRVEFTLLLAGAVTATLFDLQGRVVAQLANASFAAGAHAVRWDRRAANGRRALPGVYYLSIAAAGEHIARRIVLLD